MSDILDDHNDFERFYLTIDMHEYLKKNLNSMVKMISWNLLQLLLSLTIWYIWNNEKQEQFDQFIQKELANKPLIREINIQMFLLTGLAGLFKDIKIYHV
jgi:hypothetical protein